MNKKIFSKRGLLLVIVSLVIFLLAAQVEEGVAVPDAGNETEVPEPAVQSSLNPAIPSPDPGVLRLAPNPGGDPVTQNPRGGEIIGNSVSSVNVSSPNAWDVPADDDDKSDAVPFLEEKKLKSGVDIHIPSGAALVVPPLLDKK